MEMRAMTPKSRIAVLAASALLSVVSPIANATLFIGLQQDAGPIVTVTSNTSGFAAFSGAFGEFEAVAVSASGQPSVVLPLLLQSTSNLQNAAGAANAGTLSVYVTSTGNTGAVESMQFTSGFASVSFSGWTQTLSTYFDPGNRIYSLTQPLGSATFTRVDSDVDIAIQAPGAGAYSVTAVYSISATSLGGASSSSVGLSVSPVPEPSNWLLMLAAVGLIGWKVRRTI
jgi:hypothetical protein